MRLRLVVSHFATTHASECHERTAGHGRVDLAIQTLIRHEESDNALRYGLTILFVPARERGQSTCCISLRLITAAGGHHLNQGFDAAELGDRCLVGKIIGGQAPKSS